MKNTEKLIKLENKKNNVDLRVEQLKNKISFEKSWLRKKSDNQKKETCNDTIII